MTFLGCLGRGLWPGVCTQTRQGMQDPWTTTSLCEMLSGLFFSLVSFYSLVLARGAEPCLGTQGTKHWLGTGHRDEGGQPNHRSTTSRQAARLPGPQIKVGEIKQLLRLEGEQALFNLEPHLNGRINKETVL